MFFYAFYAIALVVLILHFTGWLKRNNLEWLVLVLAVELDQVLPQGRERGQGHGPVVHEGPGLALGVDLPS